MKLLNPCQLLELCNALSLLPFLSVSHKHIVCFWVHCWQLDCFVLGKAEASLPDEREGLRRARIWHHTEANTCMRDICNPEQSSSGFEESTLAKTVHSPYTSHSLLWGLFLFLFFPILLSLLSLWTLFQSHSCPVTSPQLEAVTKDIKVGAMLISLLGVSFKQCGDKKGGEGGQAQVLFFVSLFLSLYLHIFANELE